ncbi:hypothetical protein MKUB_54140 [Mycobacterium kubicae]|uniref:Uncharacterized protein n=1 Tax=Mycobacterium kubicae TaxID=120959 RepID=A0AAX1J3Z9_9MYCO|nr:hypothetical protein [Mycobacterium kubicae]MCV7097492.1 hypothetical protein [Mycobacterium kubicae]ORV96464.1 hypothetical protein AWC13_18655 [Mycobacterium kubicae]QNI12672.1 hypothetical protein GAN18_16980 [Mycobacterium kubicae]QPI36193.1 hypothetical protein I2456_16760 [Mycobacterium kubicae]GFG67924.1 hypothetical protein MKUB_54140 [Mycobacterium kubicae]
MGFRIQRRAKDGVFYEGWDEYLKDRNEGSGDRSLCRLLKINTQGLRDLMAKPADEIALSTEKELDVARSAGKDTMALEQEYRQDLNNAARVRRRAAFPWITPVLGTGCLSASDHANAGDIAAVPEQLAACAKQWGKLYKGGDETAKIVFDFAASLVKSRVSLPRTISLPAYESLDTDPKRSEPRPEKTLAARAALAAALLTRLFHRTAALSNQPIGHWHVASSLSDDYEFRDIERQLVEPLAKNLQIFVQLAEKREDLCFLARYLEQITLQIERDFQVVSIADAQLLTEITWHLMTRDTERYAGWSDLLFLIGLKSREYHPDRPLPFLTNLVDADGLISWLTDGLWRNTRNSWESREGPGSESDRDNFYNVVAELMSKQAKLDEDHRESPHSDQFPPGVAYVTSFDLELEMALHALRETFVQVAPFEVWRGAGPARRASLAWFYRIVNAPVDGAEPSLEALTEAGNWSLLRENALRQGNSPLWGLPVVVRLTGCPLAQLPAIGVDTETKAILHQVAQFPRGTYSVGHAALLDEHTGLHHWTAELRESVRLPRELVGNRVTRHDTSNLDRRFWMLLGVQIRDDAVRHRVAALVAAESIRGDIPEAEFETPWTGVVVNRRSEPAQRDIFQWQGLDVVSADHSEVVKALRHYTLHLLDPLSRPVDDENCRLGKDDA